MSGNSSLPPPYHSVQTAPAPHPLSQHPTVLLHENAWLRTTIKELRSKLAARDDKIALLSNKLAMCEREKKIAEHSRRGGLVLAREKLEPEDRLAAAEAKEVEKAGGVVEGGHLAHVKVEKDKEEVEKGIVPVGGDHGADQRQVNHEEESDSSNVDHGFHYGTQPQFPNLEPIMRESSKHRWLCLIRPCSLSQPILPSSIKA